MNNIIKRVWIQNRLVNIEDLTGMVFQAEIGAHTFEISGIDDTGAAVALSGTVSGVFRRPDNADIALTGAASGGVVSVTLPADCYAVPGRFGLTVFVTSNSQKVAVYACVGTVAVSSTGNVAGDTPASVEDLIDDINAAIADLNSAIGQIPASYANVMAAIAPTYSGSALYSVGSYAWYNGSLYRCTTAITTAEAWTAAHWAAAVLGDDVADLKSAIININHLNIIANVLDAFIGSDGGGGYKIGALANAKIIVFPVTSGQTYTVYKGYPMSYARIAYCATYPSINSAVTGYADFSTSALYKTFTASQTGYACVYIHSPSDSETAEQAVEKTYAYAGDYDSAMTKNLADLSGIRKVNGTNIIDLINSYEYFVWHDGYFIANNGDITANSARAYSDLILCPGGTVCNYIGETANASICGIAFYDKNGKFISGVANNATLGTEATVTAPANSWYCRITTRTTLEGITYLKMNNSVVGNTLKNVIDYVDTDAKYDLYKTLGTAEMLLVNSGAVNGSGADVAMSDYLRTDYIPVKVGDVINYAICQYTTYSALAVYDSNKTFVSNVVGVGTTTPVTGTFTAAAEGYVRFSCYKTSLNICSISFSGSVEEELNNLAVGPTFYCGSGRELSTLKAGLEAATQHMNATLYVDPGTYDLVEEFGNAWFEALDGTVTMVGLQLKNRVHVIFSPNSKVVSHYTGDNEYAQKLYSPFNAGEYGFTLENLTLECSRCRYAIHDERNGGTEQFKSQYINCKVYIDNSDNDYWSIHHCIGGGLGTNAEVVIKNCVWNNDDVGRRWGIYYHTSNSQNQNKKTMLTIEGNYFITGGISFEDAGANSNVGKSVFIVTNCSFPEKYEGTDANGVFRQNLSDSYNEVYDWNNEFRN